MLSFIILGSICVRDGEFKSIVLVGYLTRTGSKRPLAGLIFTRLSRKAILITIAYKIPRNIIKARLLYRILGKVLAVMF